VPTVKSRWLMTAMLCSGAVTAQFVSGKATRDALFLSSIDFTRLPAMLVATSACSILLVGANAFGSRRTAPGRLVPAAFLVSGLLFVLEWLLSFSNKPVAAVAVYLHVSAVGPVLASGFWLIATERFDPHTAKKRFGQIAGAGTVGGLLSAVFAERSAAAYGVAAMLPILAALQLVAAWLVRRLAAGTASTIPMDRLEDDGTAPDASGLRLVLESPYLRNLATLVLLGTTSAALVDYLFKARAVEMFGRGDELLRFFALYYAATSIVTFIVQATSSRKALERYGLALATGTPSLALLAGGIGHVAAPGFASLVVARGGESVFRSSLFRAGYELFYTPIPARQKRSAKSIIDVAFDRLGDAIGGGLVRVLIAVAPLAQSSAILTAAMVCSAAAMLVASRLNRGYVRSLEDSLLHRGAGLDLAAAASGGGRTTMGGTISRSRLFGSNPGVTRPQPAPAAVARSVALDPDVQDILHLRSRDRERVASVLSREEGMSPVLVPHVIPLLAWEPVSEHAVFALRKVAEDRVGELIDALLDPNQDFSVRRGLARVFSVCVSQRAADGLMFGLEDTRFDVRFQSARSLSSLLEKNPLVRISRELIEAAVLREVAVGRPVWESRRLLDIDDGLDASPAVDAFVRDRAGESLAHVFTLLSLILPREPLQIAFRSLHTDDRYLQGTALEYLDSVLPPQIRDGLWPFLEKRPPARRSNRPSHEVIAELLRSNHSVLLNLEELKRRSMAQLLESTM
jgi:ATP/ADP translocase